MSGVARSRLFGGNVKRRFCRLRQAVRVCLSLLFVFAVHVKRQMFSVVTVARSMQYRKGAVMCPLHRSLSSKLDKPVTPPPPRSLTPMIQLAHKLDDAVAMHFRPLGSSGGESRTVRGGRGFSRCGVCGTAMDLKKSSSGRCELTSRCEDASTGSLVREIYFRKARKIGASVSR